MASSFYKERGAYVLARAGRRHGARRRGERLMARARRMERDTVGAGDAAAAETVTPNLWHRQIHKSEDSGFGRMLWTALWMGLALILIGPALLLAKGLYGIRVALVDRLGPPRSWPWLVAAGVALGVSVATWTLWPDGVVYEVRLWAYLQVVAALLRVAFLVYAYGWPGVTRIKSSGPLVVEVGPDELPDDEEEEKAPAEESAEGPVIEIGYDDEAAAEVEDKEEENELDKEDY